ncbi:E3 ubiquitin/ISG15 ligase TRIM25-like [Engystomops pustulosus]|uniref:E3 ubiquitin/ISG15 ligase TRIM25-like n=1 Tax=Engystomops pustulosus TaxID=76066 RepID=UPI003AFACAFD
MASADLRDELCCSICLEVYTDPVTLRCGHNYCRGCVERVMDTQEGAGGYSCPDCRTRFMARPVLQGNVTLNHIAERYHTTRQEEKKSGVLCTYCIHAPVSAVRSCLLCEASLCPDHLKVHSTSPEHVLCDPSTDLTTRKCTVHKKILEYYCSDDSTCICVSCRLEGQHREHRVESLDQATEKKRRQLFQLLQQLTSNNSQMEKSFQGLEERKRRVCDRAAWVKKEVSDTIVEVRRQLEDLERRVLEEVSQQEERALRTISDLIRQLERTKDEISKKRRRIEALCHTTDHVTILQEQLSNPSQPGDPNEAPMMDDRSSQDDLSMEPISTTLHTLSDFIESVVKGIYTPEPTDLTLDVATCGDNIIVSDNLKEASYSKIKSTLPKTPQRFECNQILSRQSLASGTHYWDVEGSASGMWRVGVCYPSVARTGTTQLIGSNDKSWALEYFIGEYSAAHNGEEISVDQDVSQHRLRICLDYEAGQVSFYQRSDPIRHLHTFSALFSEPLHAAFWLGWDTTNTDSWVKIEECEQAGSS